MPRITELWAYTVEDGGPDDEGVPAFLDPLTGAWMPLMGADKERTDSLRGQAQLVADATGKTVTLRRSTGLVEVEQLQPRGGA